MKKWNNLSRTLICLIGPSGCGKTTVSKILLSNSIPKLITCTTRPIRGGEVQDLDYHYLSIDDFNSTEMIEKDCYSGNWYGTSMKEIEDKFQDYPVVCTVVTYSGFENLKKILGEKIHVISVYVSTNRDTCIQRMIDRGDSSQSIQSRIQNYDSLNEFNRNGNIHYEYQIDNSMDTIVSKNPLTGKSTIDQVSMILSDIGWFKA